MPSLHLINMQYFKLELHSIIHSFLVEQAVPLPEYVASDENCIAQMLKKEINLVAEYQYFCLCIQMVPA
jgi:hypothetical protein